MRAPGAAVAASLALGIALAGCLRPSPREAVAALAGLGLVLVLAARWRVARVVAALAAVAAAGGVRQSHARPPWSSPHLAAAEPRGGQVPRRARLIGPVSRVDDDGRLAFRVLARITHRRDGGGWRPEQATAWLRLAAGRDGMRPRRGDTILVALRLCPWAAPLAGMVGSGPGTALRRLEVSHRASAFGDWALERPGGGLAAWLDGARQAAAASFWAHLPAEGAALAQAVALGDVGGLAPAVREAWGAAGMAHLLCVSGLHVGLVAGALWSGLAGLMWLGLPRWAGERFWPRRWAAWAALPGVAAYTLFTGAQVAATRAALMGGLGVMAVALGRRGDGLNALGWAAACLLWASPAVLGSVSFALSFAAVSGLMAVGRGPAGGGAVGLGAWGHRLGRALTLSLAATWATAPITLVVFGQLPWVGVWSNLLAVPVASLAATPLALLAALRANVAPALPPLPEALLAPVMAALAALARAAAACGGPGSGVVPRSSSILVAWALASAAWSAHRLGHPRGRPAIRPLVALAALVAATGLAGQHRRGAGDGRLHVWHLAVGQGDSTLLVGPAGGAILVDGGGALTGRGFDPGRGVVLPALARLGVARLDMMVVTHPHPDHIGGLLAVAEALPVRCLVHGGTGLSLASMRALAAAVEARGGQVMAAAQLPPRLAWRGTTLSVEHPRGPGPMGTHLNLGFNDNSVVLRVEHDARCVLLTGDIEAPAERLLATAWRPCDLMKVPHHGSATSTLAATLARVAPTDVTILCGPDNLFGFPHPEVLARLEAARARVWRADRLGEIHLIGDEAGWRPGPGSRALGW